MDSLWFPGPVSCPAAAVLSVMVAKGEKGVLFTCYEITKNLSLYVETRQMQQNALGDVCLILGACLPQLLPPSSYCICLGFVGLQE